MTIWERSLDGVQMPWCIEGLEVVGDDLHVFDPDDEVMVLRREDLELLNWPNLDLPAPDLPS